MALCGFGISRRGGVLVRAGFEDVGVRSLLEFSWLRIRPHRSGSVPGSRFSSGPASDFPEAEAVCAVPERSAAHMALIFFSRRLSSFSALRALFPFGWVDEGPEFLPRPPFEPAPGPESQDDWLLLSTERLRAGAGGTVSVCCPTVWGGAEA